jgi:ferritin-like metal-binding protein YciE
MALATLHDLMIAELEDIYSAETQLVDALPKMIDGSTTASLSGAFEAHLEQTKEHVNRLKEIFSILGVKPDGTVCKGMKGLIAEASEMLEEDGDDAVRDAGIIASAQRVEHYEIAAYGSTLAFATLMGHDDISALLALTLEEEKAADELLTEIAEADVNSAAPAMDEVEVEPKAARKSVKARKGR